MQSCNCNLSPDDKVKRTENLLSGYLFYSPESEKRLADKLPSELREYFDHAIGLLLYDNRYVKTVVTHRGKLVAIYSER